MSTPYAPPQTGSAMPRAVFWYRVYTSAMALLYVACSAAYPFVTPPRAERDWIPHDWVPLVCVPLAIFYVVAACVPRKPWGWTVGLVAIAIGLTGCTIVAALPLMLKWRKPAVKAVFARL